MVECLPSLSSRGSNIYHGEKDTTEHRSSAGHARHAHLADTALWSGSRPPDRKAHPANHQRFSADAARFALSRAAPPRAEGMGRVQVGDGSGPKPGIQV